jgi:hypothetical protein
MAAPADTNFKKHRGNAKYLISVPLIDLRFSQGRCCSRNFKISGSRNIKSAALGASVRLGAHANYGVARRPVAAYLETEPAVRLKKHSGDEAFS